jgi:GntR family transcriptional regulator, transcriptional repressor for pyruvate dehydrogenase complex
MLKKAKQLSLVDIVVNQIEDAIIAGNFKPGEKLPPAAELEQTIGTSRGTMREALRVLENKGLVEIRVGVKGGVFVREANADSVSEGLARLIRQRRINLDDLARFRRVIEGDLIQLVAERIQPEEIVTLNNFLEELSEPAKRGARGWHDFLEIEVRLRKELIRISGSLMHATVLVPIHENIFAYAHDFISGERANPAEAFDDWRTIINALADYDVQTAVARTQSHIARYAARMKYGLAEHGPSKQK